MAYETVQTQSAARGLVSYKVKVNDDRAVWIKTEPDTPQSDLDVVYSLSVMFPRLQSSATSLSM